MVTPLRNFRCPDSLWEALGELAKKRETTKAALIIQGVKAVLGWQEDVPSTASTTVSIPVSSTVPTEHTEALYSHVDSVVKTRLMRLEETFLKRMKALEQELSELKVQAVTAEVQPELQPEVLDLQQEEQSVPTKSRVTKRRRSNSGTQKVNGITSSELAKRLDSSEEIIEEKRNRADFKEWSKERDPAGTSWQYDNGKYFQL
jgi:hypothetical protein